MLALAIVGQVYAIAPVAVALFIPMASEQVGHVGIAAHGSVANIFALKKPQLDPNNNPIHEKLRKNRAITVLVFMVPPSAVHLHRLPIRARLSESFERPRRPSWWQLVEKPA